MSLFDGEEYDMRERILALRKQEARRPDLTRKGYPPMVYRWVLSKHYHTSLPCHPDYAVLSYSRDRSCMLIQHEDPFYRGGGIEFLQSCLRSGRPNVSHGGKSWDPARSYNYEFHDFITKTESMATKRKVHHWLMKDAHRPARKRMTLFTSDESDDDEYLSNSPPSPSSSDSSSSEEEDVVEIASPPKKVDLIDLSS